MTIPRIKNEERPQKHSNVFLHSYSDIGQWAKPNRNLVQHLFKKNPSGQGFANVTKLRNAVESYIEFLRPFVWEKAVNESQLKDTFVSLCNQTTNIYFTGKYTSFYAAT